MMVSHHPPEPAKKSASAKAARADKKTQVFIAVFDATEALPGLEALKNHTRAKDVEAEADQTFVSLVKFKNYWENKDDIIAYRFFAAADIGNLFTQTPNPLYLFAINETLFKEARKISHEIETFWAIKEAYCKAEVLISNNGFNVRNNFQSDSAIEQLKDYGRFLKIWSQDYKIWREHVEKFLNKIEYHVPPV